MSYFSGKNGVYLITEIGGNHEGRFEYAKKLTSLAVESGADAVKLQVYSGDTLVNPRQDPDRNAHFKKFELTKDQYIELAQLCRNSNCSFVASVWDIHALDYIDEYISIYKIGSGDLTAYNVIRKTIEIQKPIILSTGLSTMSEVLDTVAFIESIDESYITEKKLAFLQCTTAYPVLDDEANLNIMAALKEKTNLPVGFSCHTIGMDAAELAVAMGAEILEIHFTDSRQGKTFRDHKISATKDEVSVLIQRIKKIRTLQGSFEKKPTKVETDSNHVVLFRRAIYPSRDIPAGTRIMEEDLVTLRPCVGLGAENFYKVVGKKLKVDVTKHQKLAFNMFE